MAYCSYCAGVLEPAQTVCSRCGRAVASAPAPVVAPAAETVSGPPSNMRIGVLLLVISLGISLVSLAGFLLTPRVLARLPATYFLRTVGLLALWIVFTICVWRRQAWARIAIVVLLIWGIGTLLTTMLRIGGSATIVYPILIDLLRVAAVFLLFTPESNAWMKKG